MQGIRWGPGKQYQGAWLILIFVVLGVLAPTGAVFWFMNEAARSQAEAARHSVTEAYSGQLRLLRQRVEDWASGRASALGEKARAGTPADFPAVLAFSGADSVILLDDHGAAVYPALPPRTRRDPDAANPAWLIAMVLEGRGSWDAAATDYSRLADTAVNTSLYARAAQSQVRCLVRGSHKSDAVENILRRFPVKSESRATDLQGRLILADERLLALQLMKHSDHRYEPVLDALVSLVNDYSVAMPSAQRLFLMAELTAIAPKRAAFPTEVAERMAAQYLEAKDPDPSGATLEATGVPDVWSIASSRGRVLALYRTTTVSTAIDHVLREQSSSPGVRFSITSPGATPAGEAIAVGPALPGWLIGFSMDADTKATEAVAHTRMASYLWEGYLVIAALTFTGILLGHSFRRQFQLAQLKTDLVATVSHEMRTPLASMRLLVECLQDDKDLDPVKTREYLDLIAGGNRRLSRLVENFLTFSQIEHNRKPFEFSLMTPKHIVDSALVAMRERLQLPQCRLNIDVQQDLPLVEADADAMVTALLNLLDNAFKYTSADPRVSVRAYAEGNRVVFCVEDNGIGIAAREQKRIFRRFYRVDQRLARETSGCGLGLNIVDSIARAHGGSVSMSSEGNSGSIFRIVLPMSPKAKETAV